ncbi:hypothetical protein E2C01_094222 [Portunus trituberculatus]|uniref:Uncharacterized protein n=1 Tax=Portunus trituberculatus TaxID=210409 RepID=A0A5B7K083_PORTR|nr:hypothetical protein [Portunus trituberculatus]
MIERCSPSLHPHPALSSRRRSSSCLSQLTEGVLSEAPPGLHHCLVPTGVRCTAYRPAFHGTTSPVLFLLAAAAAIPCDCRVTNLRPCERDGGVVTAEDMVRVRGPGAWQRLARRRPHNRGRGGNGRAAVAAAMVSRKPPHKDFSYPNQVSVSAEQQQHAQQEQ